LIWKFEDLEMKNGVFSDEGEEEKRVK